MGRSWKVISILPIATLSVYGGACSSAPVTASHDEAGAVVQVVYDPHSSRDEFQPAEYGPSDESLTQLLEHSAIEGSLRAPLWTAPANDAVLDGVAAPTISWRSTSASLDRNPGAARPRSWVPWGGERLAHAHNPPYSGVGYFLELAIDGHAPAYRLYTFHTSFTPDARLWEMLRAAAGSVTCTLRLARFTDNRIDPDGGPFAASSLHFTIRR